MNELPDPVTLLQDVDPLDTRTRQYEGPCSPTSRSAVHAGIATTLLGIYPEPSELIARLPGRGEAPPILMYGHVDVVTARRNAGPIRLLRPREGWLHLGRGAST